MYADKENPEDAATDKMVCSPHAYIKKETIVGTRTPGIVLSLFLSVGPTFAATAGVSQQAIVSRFLVLASQDARQSTAYWNTRPPRIGDVAPPLTLEHFFGAPSDTRDPTPGTWVGWNSKVIVLEFGTSWCAPCISAIPHMNKLVDQFSNDDVAFLMISNESDEAIRDLRLDNAVKSIVARDSDGSTFEDYWVNGIPHIVVIDAHRHIAAVSHPRQLTHDAIRRVLDGKPADLPVHNPEPYRQDWNLLKPMGDSFLESGFGVSLAVADKISAAVMTRTTDGYYYASGSSLRMLIRDAFDTTLSDIKTESGFNLDDDTYYSVAVRPPDGRLESSYRILRAFIQSAFHLRIEAEESNIDVRVLRRIPGARQLTVSQSDSSTGVASIGRFAKTGVTAPEFAKWLGAITNMPVVDETGLLERYDVNMRWDATTGLQGLREALKGLGFELADAKRPYPFIVVHPDSDPK